MTSRNGKQEYAHRVSYEDAYGPIPGDLWVLHHCDNRACTEPLHLFLGTNMDNINDMIQKGRHANQKKTHCPSGHAYSAENTILRPLKSGGVGRVCRACHNAKTATFNKGEKGKAMRRKMKARKKVGA